MKVKSIYQKRLSFIINDKTIGINPNEIINVDENTAKQLLQSPWIKEDLNAKCPECSQKSKIEIKKDIPEIKIEKNISENKDVLKDKNKTIDKNEKDTSENKDVLKDKNKTIDKNEKTKKVEKIQKIKD
jgi:hypothetical protein